MSLFFACFLFVFYHFVFCSWLWLSASLCYLQCINNGHTTVFTKPLNRCGLVMSYGDRDLGQHWFRKWLVAWRHQAITWTNIDVTSERSSDIHLRTISQVISLPSITEISLKIIHTNFHWNLPRVNELIHFLLNEISELHMLNFGSIAFTCLWNSLNLLCLSTQLMCHQLWEVASL